jgi:hypothetical protein
VRPVLQVPGFVKQELTQSKEKDVVPRAHRASSVMRVLQCLKCVPVGSIVKVALLFVYHAIQAIIVKQALQNKLNALMASSHNPNQKSAPTVPLATSAQRVPHLQQSVLKAPTASMAKKSAPNVLPAISASLAQSLPCFAGQVPILRVTPLSAQSVRLALSVKQEHQHLCSAGQAHFHLRVQACVRSVPQATFVLKVLGNQRFAPLVYIVNQANQDA